MEFLHSLWDFLPDLWGWKAAMLAALAVLYQTAIWLWFLFKTGKLLPMLGSFMSGIVNNAFLKKLSARVVNEGRLPELYIPRSATDFLNLAGILSHRLEVYGNTFTQMKVPFYGPYAISLTAIAQFRLGFSEHLDQSKKDLVLMAELTHQYMLLRTSYIMQLAEKTQELRDKIRIKNRDLEEVSCEIAAIGFGRFIDYRIGQLREKRRTVNDLLKRKKSIGKELRKLRKTKAKLSKDIFGQYVVKIRMLAAELALHDSETLRLGINELDADYKVMDITTQSGLFFDMLISEDGSMGKKLREYFKLPEDFPLGDYETAKDYMLAKLNGRVAFASQTPREDVLEAYLRIHLLSLEEEHPSFTKPYIENLAAPGVLGHAEEYYPDVSGERGDWLMQNNKIKELA